MKSTSQYRSIMGRICRRRPIIEATSSNDKIDETLKESTDDNVATGEMSRQTSPSCRGLGGRILRPFTHHVESGDHLRGCGGDFRDAPSVKCDAEQTDSEEEEGIEDEDENEDKDEEGKTEQSNHSNKEGTSTGSEPCAPVEKTNKNSGRQLERTLSRN